MRGGGGVKDNTEENRKTRNRSRGLRSTNDEESKEGVGSNKGGWEGLGPR